MGVAVDYSLPAAAHRGGAADPGLHHRARPRAVLAAGRADCRDGVDGPDVHTRSRRNRQAGHAVRADLPQLRLVGGAARRRADPGRVDLALARELGPSQATGGAVKSSSGSSRPDRNLALELVRVTEA